VTTSVWSLLAATPVPTPGRSPATTTPDADLVTPGVAGFLVTFLLAVATILLLRSMTKHLRKVRYSPDPAAEDAAAGPTAADGAAPEAGDQARPEPTANGGERRP
jgi:hypothetical protein